MNLLARFPQVTIIGPDSSETWHLPTKFDELARVLWTKVRKIVRAKVCCIPLDVLFSKIERRDSWHAANTTQNRIYYTEHLVRAVYVATLCSVALICWQIIHQNHQVSM